MPMRKVAHSPRVRLGVESPCSHIHRRHHRLNQPPLHRIDPPNARSAIPAARSPIPTAKFAHLSPPSVRPPVPAVDSGSTSSALPCILLWLLCILLCCICSPPAVPCSVLRILLLCSRSGGTKVSHIETNKSSLDLLGTNQT